VDGRAILAGKHDIPPGTLLAFPAFERPAEQCRALSRRKAVDNRPQEDREDQRDAELR
jgi:hypothetical protein